MLLSLEERFSINISADTDWLKDNVIRQKRLFLRVLLVTWLSKKKSRERETITRALNKKNTSICYTDGFETSKGTEPGVFSFGISYFEAMEIY